MVNVAGQIGRYTFQPGWRWSECIKPVVNTEDLPDRAHRLRGLRSAPHQAQRRHRDRLTAGSVYHIAPGHDAGNADGDPAVFVEFQGAANYAKR